MADETTPTAAETTAPETALNPIRCTNCGYNDPHGSDRCPRCNITRQMAEDRVRKAAPVTEVTEPEAVTEGPILNTEGPSVNESAQVMNGSDQPQPVAQP